MRFGVLGPVAVWSADGTPVNVPEPKVRALLALLLAAEGRPVSPDRLIEAVWSGRPPGKAANALQAKVSQLRRALEQGEPGARELVEYGPGGYRLRLEAAELDADRFHELAARARATRDSRARAGLLTRGLELWRGPAYADRATDDPFVHTAADRLEEQRLTALEELAEARLELGEHRLIADELREPVALHPLHERLHAVRLRALYGAGRQGEALAEYEALRVRLAEELGADPGPELAALHRSILRQDPALTEAVRRDRPQTNLPAPLTPLLGRSAAVTELRKLLTGHRLVTLTGAGGVGKTRLALETARLTEAEHPDGVWLVELAGIGGPCGGDPFAALTELTAGVLGIREERGRPPLPGGGAASGDPVAEALRERRLLLVLDNCEHVADAAALAVGRWLRAAPGLTVLATSQEPLGVEGELVWSVPPLALEDAVELFTARAAPGFVPTAENADAVESVCRRLDGIPLALELAATRVRALGVRELAARLDDRFAVLDAGRRDAPARQRTLRAMIDWSWELLTGPERAVLRRLSVHADGCTLDAAEAVCAGDDVPRSEVTGLLARLVDRSLVVMTEGPDGPRYRMLESVAVYSAERLAEAGESKRVRRLHRAYYLALAEATAPLLYGAGQQDALRRLDGEAANLRRAVEGAVRDGAAESALRLVNALGWYWFLRGRAREALRTLDTVLDAAKGAPEVSRAQAAVWRAGLAMAVFGDGEAVERGGEALDAYTAVAPDPRARAWARWFLALTQWGMGDQTVCVRRLEEALAGFRACGDRWGTAAALAARAFQAELEGDLAAVARHGCESLDLFSRLGDRWGQFQATDALGSVAMITADYAEAERLHRVSLELTEELGLWTQYAEKLADLGRVALLRGDHARADELLERARRLAAEHSHPVGEQYADLGLAISARRQGRLDRAEALFRAWLEPDRAARAYPALAFILAELGFIAELRGDAAGALALHEEGLANAERSADPRAVALAKEGLAGAHALAGRTGLAARLLADAAALRESTGVPLPPAERGDVDRIAARIAAAGTAAAETRPRP
ncbi:AfsR/SARP family transcriptional regulator [Streptomyces sp. HC44]|uniref:AfsR/SARP family transcriptional regulator n=1 Tax=Streptomyces scabichelini TaxID=2711217 RepID=A0A6G4V2R8_9ACTN|nr:BTAD domain-containing putative transcriptional regulator [Streptomyces scabichelini]NGO08180.1 AfsR/SARP family transcriptional regulator [Streptomyces scabichelini]